MGDNFRAIVTSLCLCQKFNDIYIDHIQKSQQCPQLVGSQGCSVLACSTCGIAQPDIIPCVLLGMMLSAVALKSKALTFTSFSYIFLTRHDRTLTSTLVDRAPFCDFCKRMTLGSSDVRHHMTFADAWLL